MRLLTPSSIPCLLLGLVCKALDLLLVSGDTFFRSGEKARFVRSAGIRGLSAGLCELSPVGMGRVAEPFREVKELVFCAVITDDPEAELGREFWRGRTGFCNVEVITITVGRFRNHAVPADRVRELFPDACPNCKDGMQFNTQE